MKTDNYINVAGQKFYRMEIPKEIRKFQCRFCAFEGTPCLNLENERKCRSPKGEYYIYVVKLSWK